MKDPFTDFPIDGPDEFDLGDDDSRADDDSGDDEDRPMTILHSRFSGQWEEQHWDPVEFDMIFNECRR